MNKSKKIAFLGLCVALALVLAYVEVLFPLFPDANGIKMGLPNIIIIFLLYRQGLPVAAGVSLARILLITLLFGNTMALLYSLAGGVLSLGVMALLKRLDILSVTGVSVAGAVMHNVGQILVAILLTQTTALGYYFVVLAITGTVAGVLIGLCSGMLIRRIPQKFV